MKNKECRNDKKYNFFEKILKIIKKICAFLLKNRKNDKNKSGNNQNKDAE